MGLLLGLHNTSFFAMEESIWMLRSLSPSCLLCMNWAQVPAWGRRRWWHPTPVLLPGKSHGQRSLVGGSSWGREESDTTEQLHFHFSLSCFGERNGNPLQCSCLENPRDGGAWWAAIYGVPQSQTRLKWLSSSSSQHEAEPQLGVDFLSQATSFLLLLPLPRVVFLTEWANTS